VALLVVGIPSLVQLTAAPALLDHLERDRAAVADGQVWRLLTSLVVQDGGVAGTVGNLVALAVVGTFAEQVWEWRSWAVIAVGSGVAAELWGLAVQPVGGGNSVAVLGLSGSLAVVALREGDRVARALAAAALAAGLWLLVTGDVHGGGMAAGAVLGVLLRRRTRTRPDLRGDVMTDHLDELETPVRAMIEATNSGDTEALVAAFAHDALLVDWGREFAGREAIARWNVGENIGHHLMVTGVTRDGDATVVAVDVTGTGFNGPGTLTFRTRDGRIEHLLIQ
jgi:rhomboid protease GluP